MSRAPVTNARIALVLGLLVVAACATGGKLKRNAEVLANDAAKARASGAQRCAPRELATAEANLDFGKAEMDWGNAGRAAEHFKVAEASMKKALDLSKNCGAAKVTINDKKPVPVAAAPAIILIEKTDRDGDGVPDLEDKCPDVPGPKENFGCPISKDSDGDGIPDDIDRCPLDPEDFDGFQDEDGCPDPDNDGDGIVDKIDACPNTPGPISNRGCPVMDRDGDGIPDQLDMCPDVPGVAPDGCPKKYALVEVKKDRIIIKQQVHFVSAKFTVMADSFPLLDQVVQVLRDQPKLRVSIEGHTDAIGGELANMKLSQARAESVRTYLVGKGIAADRLEAVGFGPTKPVASNKTEKGRGQNRRTEFRILSSD
jgi:outer membrane protein OmpA-like peptidoglycan-associated protein